MLLTAIIALLKLGCGTDGDNNKAEHAAKIEAWQQARHASLFAEDGWLNLAGLFWLKEGPNTFGAAEANDLVLEEVAERFPARIGVFYLQNGEVKFASENGAEVTHDGRRVTEIEMKTGSSDSATVLKYGSFQWYVIKRDFGVGVRVRDFENPLLRSFKALKYFPIDESLRLEATLEKYDPPKVVDVPTVMGNIRKQESPGALVFEIAGKTYRLDPVGSVEDDSLFVIFSDETNGAETYGGGRFVYTPRPDENGKTILDFNKAYNPPCAFNAYATCPLPPPQNALNVAIVAGEKNYEDAAH